MDNNQVLLDQVVGFPTQLLLENGEVLSLPTGVQLQQMPISNQNMVELGKKLLQAASDNDVESVKSLMSSGAPFTGNWLGTTPLHAAAKAGHVETVELLLKAGIFRDAKTKVDRTALQMAAEEGNTTIVQLLLDHGADVNAKDMLKMTALHWAVECCNKDCVTALLAKGADIHAVNKFEKTPIDIAQDRGFEELVQLLETTAGQRANGSAHVEATKPTEKVASDVQPIKAAAENHGNKSKDMSQSWNSSPEEDALEKLTAGTPQTTSAEAVKLLESHGISFLPVDNTTVLNSALESGQRIGLTEAGKLALNQIRSSAPVIQRPMPSSPTAKKVKLSAPAPAASTASTNLPRVVTITAQQFMALATRLQQQQQEKTGNFGKPLIISLPKNLNISTTGTPQVMSKGNVKEATVRKPVSSPLKSQAGNPVQTEKACEPQQSSAVPIKLEIVPPDTVELEQVPVPSPVLEEVETIAVEPDIPENVPDNNELCPEEERRNHFLKSGLLKGSARTTPMPLLCSRKRERPRRPSSGLEDAMLESPKGSSMAPHSTASSQQTLNHAALPLDADDEMFINEDSESHQSNPPVWLSIMQEDENGEFSSAGADGNDDDLLLDPSRLAAQLASIHRQAASQYSFSS